MAGKKDAAYKKQIENLTKRVNELEKKASSQSMAAWLAAVGTTLSGLGALGVGAKPAAPLPPAPQPIQDQDHKQNPLQRPNILPDYSSYADIRSADPPELDSFVDSLKESKLRRDLFTYAVRETDVRPTFLPGLPGKDPQSAASLLEDHSAPATLRAMSALYLGALADKHFVPTLHIAAEERGVIGEAAKVASAMIEDGDKAE